MTKPRGAPFQKGRSGNPGGRPKIPDDVRERARAYSLEALDALRDEMKNGKGAPRVSAAVAILDRAWGKPMVSIEASMQNKKVDELTDEELNALIWAGLERDGVDLEALVSEQRKNSKDQSH